PRSRARALRLHSLCFFRFLFNDASPTRLYTLSLHDALPIYLRLRQPRLGTQPQQGGRVVHRLPVGVVGAHQPLLYLVLPAVPPGDRKSTRLNSSHVKISYAVFCLKKKTLHYHALSHAFCLSS